jgi:hypothetical protein
MRKWFIFDGSGLVGYVYATNLLEADSTARSRYGDKSYRITASI